MLTAGQFIFAFTLCLGLYSEGACTESTCKDDCGSPLMLTPYIQQGKIKQAQQLSRVSQHVLQGVKSYSGFLTVNTTLGSNLFFWYFPPEKKAATPAPVLLWLQGELGKSSLYGLFTENGPLSYSKRGIRRRELHWAASSHVIYMDNPVGTGFSFTTDGYAQNQTIVARDVHAAVEQFFLLFPELQKNDLFLTGQSFAGKFIPATCLKIHQANANAKIPINLKGFAIGNGLTDPIHQLNYSNYLYQIGLVNKNGSEEIAKWEERCVSLIHSKNWTQATDSYDELFLQDQYPSLYSNLTGLKSFNNYLCAASDGLDEDFSALFSSGKFRRAIHVGNVTFNDGRMVAENLKEDFMQSEASTVAELLSHYRGLIYSGQLDVMGAYPLTENYLSHLNFSSAAEYVRAERRPWRLGDEVAGYVKVAGNLTELMMRNAGHMVPADQPTWALDMITRFTNNQPFIN